MVIEQELPNFAQWIGPAFLGWLAVIAVCALAALLIYFVVMAVTRGPVVAFDQSFGFMAGGFMDMFRMSPRRIYALARLAVQESIRRRVIVVFAVFVIVLLFAVWFLDPSNPEPAKLYLSFVLTSTRYLVLLLALFLSVFSLPNDIVKKTIYTIVTKPVRTSEIVLGRMLGFTIVGTILLAIMGVASYLFVMRALSHTHQVERAPALAAEAAQGSSDSGLRTNISQRHRHRVFMEADGKGRTDTVQGHWHRVTSSRKGNKTAYSVGGPQDLLMARVAVYAQSLSFRNSQGKEEEKGINVGNEWMYKSYIEGGSQAAAIWNFEGITPERFPRGLPLEMTLNVFRTTKGDMEQGIPGSIRLRNPRTKLEHEVAIFSPREFAITKEFIPRTLTNLSATGGQPRTLDLFDDLVDDGRVEIQIQCIPAGQYYGAAKPDLYLLAREASFLMNFVKGYISIWLQMVLLIGFGVMFSTFLNAAVALLATLSIMIAGLQTDFMTKLIAGEVPGGGPLESFYRIVSQKNVSTELDPGLGTTLAVYLDKGIRLALMAVVKVLPDLSWFSDVDWVASGFDIPFNNILLHSIGAMAYMLPLFAVAHFILKSREVAK